MGPPPPAPAPAPAPAAALEQNHPHPLAAAAAPPPSLGAAAAGADAADAADAAKAATAAAAPPSSEAQAALAPNASTLAAPPTTKIAPPTTRPLPRIASLLPSATEVVAILLARAGDPQLGHLVARSHECDWPPAAADQALREERGLPVCEVLTGAKIVFESSAQVNADVYARLAEGESLYSLNEALLERLAPDVVVTQALCQVCSVSLSLVQEIVGRIAARQNAQKTAAAAAEAGGGVGSSSSPSSTRPLPTQPKVVSLNPQCLEDVLQDLVVVGEACGLKEEGEAAAADLRARADRAEAIAKEERAKRRAAAAAAAATSDSPLPLPTVGFCEWVEPIFVGGHWTPQIIAMAGGHHPLNPPKMTGGTGAATACGFSRVIEPGSAGVCGVVGANGDDKDDGTPLVVTCGGGAGAGSAAAIAAEEEIRRQAKAGGPELCHGGERPGGASPSFAVTNETVAKLDPDFLVIAPCGLDIPTTLRELSNSGVGRSAWFRGLKAVKQGRCAVVDGNQMFNRPGPRLVDALEFFVGFLHDRPEVIPSDFPWVPFSEEILPPPAVGEEKEGGGGGGEEKAAGGG